MSIQGAIAATKRDDAYVLTHRAYMRALEDYRRDPTAETWERMDAARRLFLEAWHAA